MSEDTYVLLLAIGFSLTIVGLLFVTVLLTGKLKTKPCTKFGGETHRWKMNETKDMAVCMDCGIKIKRIEKWVRDFDTSKKAG